MPSHASGWSIIIRWKWQIVEIFFQNHQSLPNSPSLPEKNHPTNIQNAMKSNQTPKISFEETLRTMFCELTSFKNHLNQFGYFLFLMANWFLFVMCITVYCIWLYCFIAVCLCAYFNCNGSFIYSISLAFRNMFAWIAFSSYYFQCCFFLFVLILGLLYLFILLFASVNHFIQLYN